MTELENRIKESGLKKWEEIGVSIMAMKCKSRFVSIPFTTDGIIDLLFYDRKNGRLDRIEYPYRADNRYGYITKTIKLCF